MSSSNLVSVVYTPETDYGEKPDPISSVVMETARFTSEALSGTPATTTSTEIRTDRMSSGQVVTGLDVGGTIDWELASGVFWDDFFEASMMNPWTAQASQNSVIDLVPSPTDDQKADLITTTGDFDTIGPGVAEGDVLQLIPAGGSPIVVQVITKVSSTNLLVATKRGEEGFVNATFDVAIPQHLTIGKVQKSFVISKGYQDVLVDQTTDERSQTYTGSVVSAFAVNANYGEIVNGNFTTLANGYEQEAPSYQQQVVTGGGTVNPANTSNGLNASIDVPLVTSDGLASEYCVESFSIELDNGMSPSNCIGSAAPKNYTLGTANITVSASIYLSDTSYIAFMPGKLTQDPISMMFTMENADGGYAFSLTAVQLSFPDPAATGQDEQTMLEATGVAKVGENGESAIIIYKLVGDQ